MVPMFSNVGSALRTIFRVHADSMCSHRGPHYGLDKDRATDSNKNVTSMHF